MRAGRDDGDVVVIAAGARKRRRIRRGRGRRAIARRWHDGCTSNATTARLHPVLMTISTTPSGLAAFASLARNRNAMTRLLEFVVGPCVLIAVWWIAYAGKLVDPHLLPSPFATLADTGRNIASGTMTRDFVQTLLRVAYAFAIAASLGVPAGIVLGANERIYRSFEFVIDFFRST